VIKAFTLTPAMVNHRVLKSDTTDSQTCFQLFSLDFIIDEKLKPFLLKISDQPSLSSDTKMDQMMKREIVTGALRLLNLSVERKQTAKEPQISKSLKKATKIQMIETVIKEN
jgi:hypothetical protein